MINKINESKVVAYSESVDHVNYTTLRGFITYMPLNRDREVSLEIMDSIKDRMKYLVDGIGNKRQPDLMIFDTITEAIHFINNCKYLVYFNSAFETSNGKIAMSLNFQEDLSTIRNDRIEKIISDHPPEI